MHWCHTFDLSVSDSKYEWFPYGTRRYLEEQNHLFITNIYSSIVHISEPFEAQPHLIGQSVQQQHRLAPSCIDLVPLHGDAGESTQTEVVDCAKLATVPKQVHFESVDKHLLTIFATRFDKIEHAQLVTHCCIWA